MRKSYFPIVKDAPAPLCLTVKRRVRFEEVDSMGIVWHGCYPSYFEETCFSRGTASARISSARDLPRDNADRLLPPLNYEDLRSDHSPWSDAARINFEYDHTARHDTGCTVN
jgi:acyl-CoA thioester hydrolase